MRGRLQYHGGGSNFELDGEYEIKDTCAGKATFKNGDAVLAEWQLLLVQEARDVETLAVHAASGGAPSLLVRIQPEEVLRLRFKAR